MLNKSKVGALGVSTLLIAGLAVAWTPDRPLSALKSRWAASPSTFIALDGMQVHMRDEGVRDDPFPIILLHGTGSSLHTWRGWIDGLKGSHRLISLDRPGFGLTGPNPSGDYSMRYYSDFLARFLDRLDIERAIIVGHSSGGQMAWQFASRYPDRVAGLIMLAPAGYPRTTPLPAGLKIAMSPWASPLLEHILPRSEVKKGLQGMFGDPSKVTSEMVERSYQLALRPGNRKTLGQTLRQQLATDESANIANIHTPTLVIWGAKDTVVPMVPDAERFRNDIAGCELTTFSALGHMPQEEDSAATLVPVKHFLETLQRRHP
jgi:pimeloyl-ACP methyl ester carboxylesterase